MLNQKFTKIFFIACLTLVLAVAFYRPEKLPSDNASLATVNLQPKIASSTSQALPQTIDLGTWPVKRVIDGDTIIVNAQGKELRVRLIGINAPETVDPRKPVECFGREAAAEAKKNLAGQMVHLVGDPTQGTYDKYGRLLAYVFLPDGSNFNQTMIGEGYAYEYTYNLPYLYQADFQKSENVARRANLGLWSPATCAGHK